MRQSRGRVALTVTLFAIATGLVALSVIWGRRLQSRQPEIMLGAAPFVGRNPHDGWDWRIHWQLSIPILIACIVVIATPIVITRWRLRWITLVTGLTAGAFAVALALGDGVDGLFYGATHETEYYANLPTTPEWRSFLSTFVDRLPHYSVHVRGHPPGFILALKAIAAIGLHGAWPVVALSIIGVVTTPIAVLITIHRLAGPSWVRRAAPFMVIAPYAIWQVTSADAFFTAMASAGVAALAVALTATTRWQSVAASLASGLLLGLSLFLTYGTVTFLILPAIIVGASWRRWRRMTSVVALSSIAALAVLVVYQWFGFWWFDGFSALGKQYWEGTAKFRVWTYFALSNVAVLLVAVGPAVLAGVVRLRSRGLWILFSGALLAIVASEVSQYSKGEVERIWLLFYPWLMLAAAPLGPVRAGRGVATLRLWLSIQAIGTIVLQSWLVTKW